MVANVPLTSPHGLLLAENSRVSVQGSFSEGPVRTPLDIPPICVLQSLLILHIVVRCSFACGWSGEPHDVGIFALSLLPAERRDEEVREDVSVHCITASTFSLFGNALPNNLLMSPCLRKVIVRKLWKNYVENKC